MNSIADLTQLLSEIPDPEIPVLNIVEMGIVRNIEMVEETVIVKIIPTYSGCPAMYEISNNIKEKLKEKGYKNCRVEIVYSPPWTTDSFSDEALKKLKDYGIAPPGKGGKSDLLNFTRKPVSCPFCDSEKTELKSEFGSTPCKSMYYCNGCEQPFEHFKCV